MPAPPKALLEFLKPYDRAIRELTLAMRTVALSELTPCCEVIYDGPYAVSLLYGPNEKMRDGICHVVVYTRHVNLGFNHGAFLADPDGILLGTGSQIRHIHIGSPADIELPAIREYLQRALAMADVGDVPDRVRKGVTTVIKEGPPRKKRPS